MVGIKYPIIQAGMGPYSTNRLAVARVNDMPTVKEPVERIVREAEEIIRGLPQYLAEG